MDYFVFMRRCLGCLAKYPERSTPQIQRDLSYLANLMDQENDLRHSIEPLKCRLMQELLLEEPYEGVKRIECSNVMQSHPVEFYNFIMNSMTPLLQFFNNIETLSLNPLFIDTSDAQDTAAFVKFIDQLETLEHLREVHIVFLSVHDALKAAEMGLSLLSFVKLSIEIKSFSPGDFYHLAALLAEEIEIDEIIFPEGFLFSSEKSLDDMFKYFTGLNSIEVSLTSC